MEAPETLSEVWQPDASIEVSMTSENECRIVANRAGLLTLAKLLLFVRGQPAGYHFHVDPWGGGLDDRSSARLVLELGD